MTESWVGVYVVKRDASGKEEHAERVGGHRLEYAELARIKRENCERDLDKSRGFSAELRSEEWDGYTLVSVDGKPAKPIADERAPDLRAAPETPPMHSLGRDRCAGGKGGDR